MSGEESGRGTGSSEAVKSQNDGGPEDMERKRSDGSEQPTQSYGRLVVAARAVRLGGLGEFG